MWSLYHISMEIASEICTLLIGPKLSFHVICCQDVQSSLGIPALALRVLFPASVLLLEAGNLPMSLCQAETLASL